MIHLSEKFYRMWGVALGGSAALSLVIGCPTPSRSQQAASPISAAVPASEPPAVSPQQLMASIKSPTDISPVREGIRNGTLFYATSPLPEQALRQADGTPSGASFTVPLTVDRVHNRLFVQALVDNRKVRIILDTGSMPVISLNETTAHGIEISDKVPIQIGGSQGYAPATLGLAKRLTLGTLVLQQVAVSVSRDGAFYDCTLGLSMFEHYRVTLDFAAKTMTLTRGGVPTPPPGGRALSIPFDDDNGYIFIPVRVLDQAGWAMLDTGSDATCVSLKAAKAAATHLSPSDAKSVVLTQKIGAGETEKKVTALALKVPVPISINTGHEDAEFNTTSLIGLSDMDDIKNPMTEAHPNRNVQLGFPFFLQFQRVIIDYPRHMLTLQYPVQDTPISEATSSFVGRDRAWPGYKWLQKGYAWIEVPDGKSAPMPPLLISPSPTTVTSTTTVTTKAGTTTTVITKDGMTTATNTKGLNVIVSPPDNGSITVTINGQKSVYPFPPGTTVKVTNEGTVLILPPGSTVKEGADGTTIVTTGTAK